MKKPWLYLLFILSLFIVTENSIFGQTKTPQNIVSQKNDPKKQLADSLYKLGEKYEATQDYKQAMVFYENSLKTYEIIGENKRIGDCLNSIGTIYYFKGDYQKVLYFLKKGIDAFKKAGYKKGIAALLNNIGGNYYMIGNYPLALDFYKQAVIIHQEIGAEKNAAATTTNIGGIYSKLKDYANSMKYHNMAYITYKKLNDQKGIAQSLNSIGIDYIKLGNYEKAADNLNQALTIIDKENDKQLKIQVLSSLGELFYQKLDFQKSLSYFNLCLQYAKETNTLYIIDSQVSIGNIFHKLKRYQEAVNQCKTGLKIAEKLGIVSLEKDACECLYKSYKSLGNNQLALYYYEKTNTFKDSLKIEETSNKMMNMEFQKQQLVDSIAYVKKQNIIEQKHKEEVQKKEKQRNIIIASLCFMLLVAGGLWSSLNFVRKSREALRVEKDRSEALLLNILPAEIADELKEKGSVDAKNFEMVSILFTDFKSFTQTAEKMSPQSLVEEINECFKAFDLISEKYQIEKIKTIGDAYMAAGGMSNLDKNSSKSIVLAALEMQGFVTKRKLENQQTQKPSFEMRLGIHTGPIVAGIVGVKKFQYDVWGDTVNTASRMESNGMVGKVNISETLYQLIKDEACFAFEYRGNINAKGKGDIQMYFVEKTV